MTGVQKILARAANCSEVSVGQSIVLAQGVLSQGVLSQGVLSQGAANLSDTDPYGGAYGFLYCPQRAVTVPRGIFVDLGGALRNDATSEEVANHLHACLCDILAPDIAVEIGGDSLTYLTMDDRHKTVERLTVGNACFGVLFECDYLAVTYAHEHGLLLRPAFNDGVQDFEAVLSVDLSAV